MKNILVFMAEGCEEIEALTTVDLCRRAGITVTTVSIMGSNIVTGSHGITFSTDDIIENVDFQSYDMIVLPGGMPGTINLGECDELMKHVDEFASSNDRFVAAICAAPTILGKRGILNGKKACVYPGKESELKGASVNTNSVNIDGNIITSRGLGTAIDFALAIIQVLIGEESATKIAKSVVYK